MFLAVFRGFWTVLIILGLVSALTGGFFLVCGVPFISHRLYKLGGAFLIAAGKTLTTVCACVEFEMYTASRGKRECADMNTCCSFSSCQLLIPVTKQAGLQHRCHPAIQSCNNSRCKYCYRGNSRAEEELHSSAVKSPYLSLSLCSLFVPIHASALRSVDGGRGCEELHFAGVGRIVSRCTGFRVLWAVIYVCSSWCTSGACLRVGLHAGGPCAAWKQMSWLC